MSNSIQINNAIFRDTVFGVLSLLTGILFLATGFLLAHTPMFPFIAAGTVTGASALYFLQRAFRMDRHRLQIV
jgi:hypothetical protein